MKIVIFGTGSSSDKFLANLNMNEVEIICFLDNNVAVQFTEFRGIPIFPPSHIQNFEFDYVFIASQYSIEILQQLLALNVPYHKIVPTDYNHHINENRALYQEVLSKVILNHTNVKENRTKLKIAIVNSNFSSSNGYSLYKYIPEYIIDKYEVDLLDNNSPVNLKGYDVICSSSHEGIYDNQHINIELWHGFPIKRMGVMHEEWATEKFLKYQLHRSKNIHLILSYSHLYTTFFNACFPHDSNKYRITGMPRNDLLFEPGSQNKLEKICRKDLSSYQIVYYFPTWRKGKNERVDSTKEWNYIFGFLDESTEELINFVESNNIFLVVKLHPFEYNDYKNKEIFKHEQIFLLSEEILASQQVHLYELLSCSKVLITDYSSIFFDTLLLDIPVLFAPINLDEYSEKRGFLLQPYDYLTPGPTVLSFKDLKAELLMYLKGHDRFKDERERVRKLVFQFTDNKSSVRAWAEIDKYLSSSH